MESPRTICGHFSSGRMLASACLIIAAAATIAYTKPAAKPEVELQLVIQPAGIRFNEPWVVLLQKYSGEHVGIKTTVAPGKVVFKHLRPGIYMACLQGTSGRERCRSIDMNLPPEELSSHRFTMILTAPDLLLNRVDLHTIAIKQLQLPPEVTREFVDSHQASLKGDQEDMVRHLRHALEIAPDFVPALNNLSAYYHRIGDQDRTVEYATKATQLDPSHYSAWVNLSAGFLSLHRWEEALKAALCAVDLRPEDATCNSQVALSYYYLRRYSEAEQYFKKVLELDPSFCGMPMLFLAHISLMKHSTSDAEAYISDFLRRHPNSPEAAFWKTTLNALTTGNLTKASDAAADLPRN